MFIEVQFLLTYFIDKVINIHLIRSYILETVVQNS